jgi:hypothetical protein
MFLVQDQTKKGLWRPPATRVAGVHALLIGISNYPHLAGGRGPFARDPGGMGQLEVCALTAARVFDWLNKTGGLAGAPLATCRLLLAPRDGERAEVDRLTNGYYDAGDFTSVRAAIEAWRDSVFAAANENDANVAFFFFSGHGVEHLGSPSLLASDILNPQSAGGATSAISFEPLCKAVKTLGIDRALLLIDACRNAPDIVKMLHIVGEDVIKPLADPIKYPDALVWLQSTRAGAWAYQDPTDPATIFGQAVLDGLEGLPPSYVPYNTKGDPWRLIFRDLESYVKQRVRELLARKSATKIQPVEPNGIPYDGDMLVAERPGPKVETGAPEGPPPISAPPPPVGPSGPLDPSLADVLTSRSSEILRGFVQLSENEVAPLRRSAIQQPGYRGDLADYDIMRRIFKHETITNPWIDTLEIIDAENESPLPPQTVELWEASSEQVHNTLTAWVDVRVEPGGGRAVWIRAGGKVGHPCYAVIIPRDQNYSVPVRLDIAYRLQDGDAEWTLDAMSARVAKPRNNLGSSDAQRIWEGLWHVQVVEALSDLGRAGMAAGQFVEMEDVLREKLESPVAAAIAATVLLRCGGLDYLHDWPRNLANWIEWLPDGPVLWAETLLRRNDRARKLRHIVERGQRPGVAGSAYSDDAAQVRSLAIQPEYKEARQFFAKLSDRGPPLLTASLTMAARQVPFWRRVIETDMVAGPEFFDLQEACEVVDRATSYAVSDGLFGGFVSREKQLSPHAVLSGRRWTGTKKAA